MSEPETRYDRNYALSHSTPLDNWLFQVLLHLLRPSPGWRVLDVGCNTGELTALLSMHQCRTRGIDVNPSAITLARERFPALSFEAVGLDELVDTGFDGIVTSHVIEHVENVDGFLTAARQRLRPTGRLVVATPNRAAFLHRIAHRIRGIPFFHDPTHHHLFAPWELRNALRRAGFSQVRIVTGPLYFPFSSRLPHRIRMGIPGFGMGDHLFAVASIG